MPERPVTANPDSLIAITMTCINCKMCVRIPWVFTAFIWQASVARWKLYCFMDVLKSFIVIVCMLLTAHATLAGETQANQPATLKEMLSISPSQLENCDIARMNILCAEGLPGTDNLKVDDYMVTLDLWAQHTKAQLC